MDAPGDTLRAPRYRVKTVAGAHRRDQTLGVLLACGCPTRGCRAVVTRVSRQSQDLPVWTQQPKPAGETSVARKGFAGRLKSKGFIPGKSNGVRI
jgi:hypothetical protein